MHTPWSCSSKRKSGHLAAATEETSCVDTVCVTRAGEWGKGACPELFSHMSTALSVYSAVGWIQFKLFRVLPTYWVWLSLFWACFTLFVCWGFFFLYWFIVIVEIKPYCIGQTGFKLTICLGLPSCKTISLCHQACLWSPPLFFQLQGCKSDWH